MMLEDIFSISKGKKPPELFDLPLADSIPFIKIDGIRNAGQHQYCEPVLGLIVCDESDVLVVWDGAYCGLTGFGLAGAIGSTIARLRPKTAEVFGPYAGHFLQSKFREIQNNATGAAIPHVNGGHLRRLEIPLPPLDEQKRIAALLDKADALRRKRKESLELTEQLLQSVFIDMFGDPATNPKGLPMLELGKFGLVQTGNTPPRSNKVNYAETGLEWIKTDNIIENRVVVTPSLERLSETGAKTARIAPAGSLLVACIAGSEKSIGRAALTDRKVAFNQQINSITPNAKTASLFLYILVKTARRQIQMAAGKGMKKMINKSTFEGLRFIAPEYEDQLRFERVAKRLIERNKDCQEQLHHFEELFSSIQQRAFRGELDLRKIVFDDNVAVYEKEEEEEPMAAILPGRYKDQGSFTTPPDIEAQLVSLESKLYYGVIDYLPWSSDFFKYRTLSKVLDAPFNFEEIWYEAAHDMPDATYEIVKDQVLEFLEQGVLEQRFDEKRKEIVFYPRA